MKRKEETTCYSYFTICSEGEILNYVGFVAEENSDFDPDHITELLGIEPHSKWREGDPHPRPSAGIFSFSRWSACRQESPADNAYEQCLAIVRMLKDKIPALMQIKREYKVWFGIEIVPEIHNEDAPAISFDEEIIAFCHATGTMIDIDTYVYDRESWLRRLFDKVCNYRYKFIRRKVPPMPTILFQGDSVTDCGRDRDDPDGLGGGYPLYVSQALPGVNVLNRGISGNRAKDLAARWQEDCLDLNPDMVSILIGINDVWRRYDSNDPTSDAAFEASYRKILEPLRARQVKFLLIAPFLLDVSEGVTAMREDLEGKQAVVRRLAEEYGAILLDADALFREAVEAQVAASAHYAGDGVHPTEAGHRLLAKAILKSCWPKVN